MKSNLNKLIDKLNKLRNNCAIPVSSLNELNQVAIALKRAGYKGQFSSDYDSKRFRNHIGDAKYFCYSSNDGLQRHPIGISVYNVQGKDKEYMIVNWDVTEPCYSNKLLRL